MKIIGYKSYKWFRFLRLPSGLLWEQLILPFYIRKKYSNAILLNLINLAPVFYKYNAVVLHDVAFKKYPGFFKKIFLLVYNTLVPIILKRAKKIFTVSEFSKSEIINLFKINENKISVIYNAIDNKLKSRIDEKKDKYILAVGSLEPRKNISKLIDVISNQEDIKLIVVGEQNSKVFNSNTDIKVSNNIKFTGYIDSNELEIFYQHATVFIYPSLYEGFGIPPLEAQSFGIPVVVSDIPVFHEVYGDSVSYVNPYSSTDILYGIKKLIGDEELQHSLIDKGYENVKKYSWNKSAVKLLKCLK